MNSLLSMLKAVVHSIFSPSPVSSPPVDDGPADGAAVWQPVEAVCALLALVAVLALSPTAGAQGIGDTRYFASPTRLFGATNAYTIVPAVGDKVAIVRTLEVVNDLAPGRIAIWTNGPQVVIPYDVASSNIQVASSGTNGIALGSTLLIHIGNTPNDRYYRARAVSATTTNILITPSLTETIPAGSFLYVCSTNTTFTGVTNGATSLRNSFIAVGQRGQPMLIDTTIGAAGSLNAAGEYNGER